MTGSHAPPTESAGPTHSQHQGSHAGISPVAKQEEFYNPKYLNSPDTPVFKKSQVGRLVIESQIGGCAAVSARWVCCSLIDVIICEPRASKWLQ